MSAINILSALRGLVIISVLVAPRSAPAQPTPPPQAAPVEKLSATTYRVGSMRIDTAKRELVIPGTIIASPTLEFVATTPGGMKAYESALTLDSNAITFNAALILLGFDPARSRPSAMQFDRRPPQGDPLEIEVEWRDNGRTQRVKAEELLYDQRTMKPLPEAQWVYTGSVFIDTGDGAGKKFLAELDGVLIAFMHGPQESSIARGTMRLTATVLSS